MCLEYDEDYDIGINDYWLNRSGRINAHLERLGELIYTVSIREQQVRF